jgi:hypothetical protein
VDPRMTTAVLLTLALLLLVAAAGGVSGLRYTDGDDDNGARR